MKASVDGRPWNRDMSIKWKGAEKGTVRSQYVKDPTGTRTQIVLSSSNTGKPTLPSLRKIGMAMWSVKVVEDVPSLFLAYVEST